MRLAFRAQGKVLLLHVTGAGSMLTSAALMLQHWQHRAQPLFRPSACTYLHEGMFLNYCTMMRLLQQLLVLYHG